MVWKRSDVTVNSTHSLQVDSVRCRRQQAIASSVARL